MNQARRRAVEEGCDVDDCGHVLQAEQPERAWGAVSKFLAG